ncbi:hypothetical protein GCM10023194_53280 [Planotetraspora phitsanulokensis]|uniref:Pentapeptide repeat-containing protein n=1 Tax=Planotetraspora phitsanulokensis TaxID=575192 RepID=A0A8J3XK22_9ACTN|nr:pentapeptide repeat-containing protein [Planotetraspora phitsanulokensis]GII42666.1 hypothetical protein Pph01_76690 [Planotetraspora phitsanulokensis]
MAQAAKRGEGFDVESRLPVSASEMKSAVTWLALVLAYIDMKWPHAAAKTRDSLTDALATVTPALVDQNAPGRADDLILREALRQYALPPASRQLAGATALALFWATPHEAPVPRDLRGADISQTMATRMDFRGRQLAGARLTGLDLRHEDFAGASAAGASFKGARLDRVNLRGTDLSGADFNGACLRGADLSGAVVTGSRIDGADLTDVVLTDSARKSMIGTPIAPKAASSPCR